MAILLFNIRNVQTNLNKELHDLRNRVERCEKQGISNSTRIEKIEKTVSNTELFIYNMLKEKKIPYVFSARPRNRNFTGRTEEIQALKNIFKTEEKLKEKKVRFAAVCGLGGTGKTSLASEYAHEMKGFYKGGVYWFSGENDRSLNKSLTAIASKISALLDSFDSTLPNTLEKISTSNDPCLIVVDCLDQLNLSSKIIELIFLAAQQNIHGDFLVLTRRNPTLLVNEVSVFEKDCCLKLECFQLKEAKDFLFLRTGVARHESVETDANDLCEELGKLPLALEQAGAYIQRLQCGFSLYLEQYKTERLRLLNREPARAVGNDSPARLAVDTTWLINMEYIKQRPNGLAAVRFMNACSFFDRNEIGEELINVGTPEVEDVAFRKCVSSPLGCREILTLLTDFSLFSYIDTHSISTHCLVQEVVRKNLDLNSKVESFIDAVCFLAYAFSKCSSPSDLVSFGEQNYDQQNEVKFDLHGDPSHFYMWSKLCLHGHHILTHMESFLANSDFGFVDTVWSLEAAKILYECAVHLSANHKQEEAKRILNFAYRTLDWVPSQQFEIVKKNILNNLLFALSIPLRKSIHTVIKRCCIPPIVLLESVMDAHACETGNLVPETTDLTPGNSEVNDHACEIITEFDQENSDPTSVTSNSAPAKDRVASIEISPVFDTRNFNLEHGIEELRSKAEKCLEEGRYEDALKYINEYITFRPDCSMGYAIKEIALDPSNQQVCAEIVAFLANYRNKNIFSNYLPFKEHFSELQERIFICNSVDEITKAVYSKGVERDLCKILLLGSEEYILEPETLVLPWNECILVGMRKNCAVSVKTDYDILLSKCVLTNLSFYFNKGQMCCLPGSLVKILNCDFTSNVDDEESAAVVAQGEFNAEKCNFSNKKGMGLSCTDSGNATVVACTFLGNGTSGLQVRDGARLNVDKTCIYESILDGLSVGPNAAKCVVTHCKILHNLWDGINVQESNNVEIFGNEISCNGTSGIFVTNSDVDIVKNNFLENRTWGIWSQCNSFCKIKTNRVFGNKCGGVRIGYRAKGQEVSPSVVEHNKIYNNGGPGFVETMTDEELEANANLRRSYLTCSNNYNAAKCGDNEVSNNKERINCVGLNFSVPYCSNCAAECEGSKCEKCFTAAYCNERCKDAHWSKHEKMCNILREKSSRLMSSTSNSSNETQHNGSRFVVKVLFDALKKVVAILHPRYGILGIFDSEVISELVEEFGMLSEEDFNIKGLFFYCLIEGSGKLVLFTNEFPAFESW